MPRPRDIAAIDTLIGFRSPADVDRNPANVRASQRGDKHPADYMYKDIPETARPDDDDATVIADTLAAMDANGVGVGLVPLSHPASVPAAKAFPDRFALVTQVDPNDVMGAVRQIRDERGAHGIRAVAAFPAGTSPQIRLDDAHWYPVYAACVELGLPFFSTVGVPGPRVPMDAQHVEALDRVMYDFPELVLVMRHGAEPWEDLAVKLMLKWPGLHYSTSAFAPKHYPRAIVDFANTRGAEKVLYAGYHPYALELDRIFAELDEVPFRDHVWEPFLRGNAARILGLAGPATHP
ncbi:MAG: amidohydrolase family protein [Actinomycetota bacterium]